MDLDGVLREHQDAKESEADEDWGDGDHKEHHSEECDFEGDDESVESLAVLKIPRHIDDPFVWRFQLSDLWS